MIGLSAVAEKFKFPYPILLIVAGIAIGFAPEVPKIEINPEIVFLIFLPPLLYDAAFNISFTDFKTHISTISTLAITLVFLTTLGIAVVARYLVPGMTWPLAFVLGAILSATDAVAAMSITRGLNISHKTNTILEGESLINDASALVAYRFAVAAVGGASFILWKASLEFVMLLAGGIVIGSLMSRLIFLLKFVRQSPMIIISFLLLLPFVTYLLAEELHVSGVIAVVTLGLSIAFVSNKVFPDNLKNQSRHIWDIIIFMLNGLIFILIGLQYPYVLKNIPKDQVIPYLLYALLITVVTLLIRTLRVFMQRSRLKKALSMKRSRITKEALLDFRTSLIISWSGMRGIVSLAIAIGLPKELEDGTPFPLRNEIIFISVAVVLFTLLGQGLTLPWLVKKLSSEKEC
ncbi:sodium:proton exchanger [Flavobacterium akiainvivens]|uniref:Sodium:proton exchanger n=2 Tax=Flavobacterium akiainvivens TaxID=1202724 RepID=A0A0M8MKR7_9FLAO|nr:sodium:proton exchanger [Flavobacterium akiainvivens]